MGSPAQTAPLVLSQGGVKNCQEDTALREPSECPPAQPQVGVQWVSPVHPPRQCPAAHKSPGQSQQQVGAPPPKQEAQGGPHLQRLWSSPPGPHRSRW